MFVHRGRVIFDMLGKYKIHESKRLGEVLSNRRLKALLGNLQHNDMATNEEVRRDYGVHQDG